MTHPAPWKIELVKNLENDIENNPVLVLVGISGIGNAQLQNIRKSLKGKARLRVVRKRFLLRALESSKKEHIQDLAGIADGQIALVTTTSAPTVIGKMLESTRQKALAKGGEIAEEDIVIPEMVTEFPPGPMMSEFQKVGLQTGIEKGKIAIKKENLLVKAGEHIPKDRARILAKLGIPSVNSGLEIMGAYSEGLIFNREVMSINEDLVISNITVAFSQAKNIALEAMFLVPEILPSLIVKARISAEQLAVMTGTLDESNVELFILKAIREANSLNRAVSGDETTKQEEKKEKTEKKAEAEDNSDKVSEGLSSLFG